MKTLKIFENKKILNAQFTLEFLVINISKNLLFFKIIFVILLNL